MRTSRTGRLPAILLAATVLTSKGALADDDLAAFRDRFRAGLARLEAGQTAEAIVTWEAVYAELGPTRGYRLAYNLGIAYDRYGDASRAAERFLAFLSEVQARRERGENLDAALLKQADDATVRMAEISRSKGRIDIRSAERIPVQIDDGEARVSPFTAFVPPGRHTLTFEPGSPRARRVEVRVQEGESYEVTAPQLAPEPAPPPTRPTPEPSFPAPPPARPTNIERPFPWPVLAGAGGLTAVTTLIPVFTYSHAGDLRAQYDATRDPSRQDQLATDYDSARGTAYATLAIPITLAAATLGLSLWYVLGSKTPAPNGALGPGVLEGRF
jgi:hypothetical protein